MSKSGKLAVAVGVLAAGTAWAGTRYSANVSVNVTGRQASGAMGTAYNSPDTNQYIGCWVTSYSTGTTSVNCAARDAAGMNGWCVTSSAELVKVALSINSESHVRFNWDEGGNCTQLAVNNFSYWDKK